MKKRGLIILISLAGLIAVLAATLFFLGRSEKGHQFVVDKSLSALEQALEARITIGGTSGNLLGRLVWNEVKMVREDMEVEVERISFRIDYLALRDSHIHLTGFKALNPRVVFKQPWVSPETGIPAQTPGRIGEADLAPDQAPPSLPEQAPPKREEPVPTAPDSREKGWRVSLDGARLEGGVLQGLARAMGQPCLGDLNDIDAKVDFSLDQDWGIRGGLTGLVAVDGRPVRLEIRGEFKDKLVKADSVKIRFGQEERSLLELKGDFDPLVLAGQADFQARLTPVDLHYLVNSFQPGAVDLDLLEGEFNLLGQIGFPGDRVRLALKGDWEKTGLNLEADFNPQDLNIQASGKITDLDPVRLAKISGTELPSGKTGFRFNLKGKIPDSLSLDLDLDEVDLDGYGRVLGGKINSQLESGILSAKADLNGLAGFKAGIERLKLEGRIDAQEIQAQISFTNATGYKAKADSGSFQLVWANNTLAVSNLDLAREQGRITGSIRAKMDQGRLASGQADLNLDGFNPPTNLVWDLMGLYLPVVDLSSVRLTGPIKADWPGREMKLSFPGLKVDSQWGKIQGPGMIKLNAQGELDEYALDLDVSQFAVPGWLWSLLPVELKKAIVNGRLKVKGDQFKAVFEANLGGTSINGQRINRFALAGEYGPKGALVKGLDVSFLGTEIKAKGQAWPRMNLKTEIRGARPQETVVQLQKMGLALAPLPFTLDQYAFKGMVSGAFIEPGIKGNLELIAPAMDKYRAQKADLEIDLKRLPIKNLEKASGNIRARINKADLGQGNKLDLDLSAANTETGLGGRFNLALARLEAQADWSLALAPGKKGLGFVLNDLIMTLPKGGGSETWRSVKPLEVDLKKDSMVQAEIHLAGPGGQSLDLGLRHAIDSISGQGSLRGLDLSSWAKALGLENVDQGFVSATLELGGSLEQPSLNLKGQVRDLVFLGRSAGQVDWNLSLGQGLLKAGLTGRNKGRDFVRASARINLLTQTAFPDFQPDLSSLWIDLDIDGLDLAAWAAALKDDRFKQGLLYARLTAKGPPEKLRAELRGKVRDLVVLDQSVGDLLLDADLENRQLALKAEIRDKNVTLLKAHGGLALAKYDRGGPFKPDLATLKADIDIKDLDLARFGPAIPQIEGLGGKMNAKLDLAPRPKGWIKVQGLQYRMADTGQAMENGRVSLVLDRTRLNLEECRAETGGGTLTGEGWLDFSGDMPLEFKAALDKAEMLLGPYGRSTIKANLAVTQSLTSPLISGKVALLGLHFRQPKSDLEESDEIILVDEQLNGRQPPKAPEKLKMDLELDLGDKTPIRGEGLRAKIGGQLKIQKEPGQTLRVKGQADFKEGIYARFGRRFIIQRGKLVFKGQEKPDPALNIEATTRVSSVDIDLGIGGTATKPDFILSSRPLMDRDEILSYLIFGQSASGYTETQDGKTKAQPIGLLGGPATELVKGIVSDRLAPDSMAVSASTEGGVAVEAGKQLWPNLFFSYVAYSEPDKPNEFKIEYRFTPNLAVESTLGDPETTGVDINFNYDF